MLLISLQRLIFLQVQFILSRRTWSWSTGICNEQLCATYLGSFCKHIPWRIVTSPALICTRKSAEPQPLPSPALPAVHLREKHIKAVRCLRSSQGTIEGSKHNKDTTNTDEGDGIRFDLDSTFTNPVYNIESAYKVACSRLFLSLYLPYRCPRLAYEQIQSSHQAPFRAHYSRTLHPKTDSINKKRERGNAILLFTITCQFTAVCSSTKYESPRQYETACEIRRKRKRQFKSGLRYLLSSMQKHGYTLII